MDHVISLLQQKNQFLEQYFDLNEAELANFVKAEFENLESFYGSREGILETIRTIDENLEKAQRETLATPTLEQRHHVEDLLAIKDDLVKEILAQDIQILSLIEQAKSNIIRELQAVRHNRKAVGAYKSPRVIALLDEEI